MKNRLQINSIICLIFLLLISYKSASQESTTKSSAGGPATAQELIGYWRMVPLPNSAENKVNPWPQKYQWFEFTKEGKINSMMNSEDKKYSPKELHTIFEVFPKHRVPNYKIQGEFIIIDNPEVKNYLEVWGTNIFAKDIDGVAEKGDLIMTLDDGTLTGKVIYYRLLRRIK